MAERQEAGKILVWHQGALGDVVLSLPALEALAQRYPGAQFVLAGQPASLSLLRMQVPVAAVWDSGAARWAPLFTTDLPLPPDLGGTLAGFDAAIIFAPRPRKELAQRLQTAGIPEVLWVCSFSPAGGGPVSQAQADSLREQGIAVRGAPPRLRLPPQMLQEARACLASHFSLGSGPLVAVAPGSGHLKKNWPLEKYLETVRLLQRQQSAQVAWIIGPADGPLKTRLLQKDVFQTNALWENLPLPVLAARLACCQLYLGNDSGLTHLATAVAGPEVVALFGPSDPQVWAPLGDRVTVIQSTRPCAPCTVGREISCPDPVCWDEVIPAAVAAAARLRLTPLTSP